jgi:hypothetical protein
MQDLARVSSPIRIPASFHSFWSSICLSAQRITGSQVSVLRTGTEHHQLDINRSLNNSCPVRCRDTAAGQARGRGDATGPTPVPEVEKLKPRHRGLTHNRGRFLLSCVRHGYEPICIPIPCTCRCTAAAFDSENAPAACAQGVFPRAPEWRLTPTSSTATSLAMSLVGVRQCRWAPNAPPRAMCGVRSLAHQDGQG